jgi:tetratricopeptide (TPR) repeat protein
MHASAAAALAGDPRAAQHATEIAHHWFEAGPAGAPEEAVTWLCRAAEQALGLLAHEEATILYRKASTALDWMPAPDDRRRAEVFLGLGEACRRAGETDDAKEAFLAAAALARTLAAPELLTRAALGFAPAVAFAEQPAPDPAVVRLLEEAIAAWGDLESGLHARALARVALLFLFSAPDRTAALNARAIGMARRVGDDVTLRDVLARSLSTFNQRTDPRERLALATELLQLAEETGDLESRASGHLWRCVNLLECGDVAAMRREQPALTRAAAQLRQPAWSWYAHLMDVNVAVLDGRLGDAEAAIGDALRVGEAILPFAARGYFMTLMLFLRTLQGRAGEFASEYRRMAEGHPSPSSISPLAWVESERGNAAEARRIVDRVTAGDFIHLRTEGVAIVAAAFLVDACALLGDAPRAAWLYEFMAPRASHWVAWAEATTLGPVAYYLGVLARTLGRVDDAATHFEDALAQASRADSPIFLARAQFEYARLLRDRGEPSDRVRSSTLLDEARATAESIGMAGLVAKIDALQPPAPVESDRPSPQIFRREGDFWTIAFAGKEIRLHDLRGLHYLAALLREPGREFHATDLVRGGHGPSFAPPIDDTLRVASGLGDAGEHLDARARAAYKARLADLDDELADAEHLNDRGRLERAREEREALLAELGAAARGKRASSDAERGRVTATKGIKAALDKIAASHPELGAHLHATVRRGYFCSYVPDPRHPIEWET